MKKNLPTGIANELEASSVFFQRQNTSDDKQSEPEVAGISSKHVDVEQSLPQSSVTPRHHATTVARQDDTKSVTNQPSRQPGKAAANQIAMDATTLETMRKEVKRVGKEAATHRFTAEEKMALADLVYTYSRQGVKTSENEITRIAVNWLLLDYEQHGKHSVLARMLESLHG